MGDSIYYKKEIVGDLQYELTKDGRKVGWVTFEGLETLIQILTAPNDDIIEIRDNGHSETDKYFGKRTIIDFKDMLKKEGFGIFISGEKRRLYNSFKFS